MPWRACRHGANDAMSISGESRADKLPMQSIPAMVQANGRRNGDKVALIDDTRVVSYRELAEYCVHTTRGFMASGIAPGDRVCLWAPNSIEWIAAAVGIQGAGAAVVPADSRLRAGEVAALVRRVSAAALVCSGIFRGYDFVQELAEADPEIAGRIKLVLPPAAHYSGMSWESFLDHGSTVERALALDQISSVRPGGLADIIYTSGTTGKPKGVISTHHQNLWSYAKFNELLGLTADDRQILVAPFAHCFGCKAGWMLTLQVGATGVLVDSYDAERLLATIERVAATVIPAPPTVLRELLEHHSRRGRDLSSLHLALTGSTTVPVELIRRLRAELLDSVVVGYGLTEATGIVTSTRAGDDTEVAATTVGRPLAGVEVKVVDPEGMSCPFGTTGEVLVRGPNVMPGYVDDPLATAEVLTDGWLRTGDLASLDNRGYLTIRGRAKEMYISGGYNVYPAEVENALLEYDDIAAAAVVGIPDQRMGEVGVAYIVPRDPASFTVDALATWVRGRLANYKLPRRYQIVSALPRNSLGKVLKRDLPGPSGEDAGLQ